ncbi:hypothetical protein COCVIDRAFT_110669, partial [Bipolaris victoriae FI3]
GPGGATINAADERRAHHYSSRAWFTIAMSIMCSCLYPSTYAHKDGWCDGMPNARVPTG